MKRICPLTILLVAGCVGLSAYAMPIGVRIAIMGRAAERQAASIVQAGLEDAFSALPVTVEADGERGWKVTLTNDMDLSEGPLVIPDNLGALTIDLAGRDLVGANGQDASSAGEGGDGQSAVRIVQGPGGGYPTALTVVTSGGDATVKGGDGGAGSPGGNGAPAIEVADGARNGVLVNVGAGVTVRGGAGGTAETGSDGEGGAGIVGDVGTNDGVILPYALTDAMVGEIPAQLFADAEAKPEPVVYDEVRDKVLAEGTDYVLSWANNSRPGKASVTVAGRGDYLGKVTRLFTVVMPFEHSLTAGNYFKATLAELGYDVPTNGTPYAVTALGLPAGLQLMCNAAVKDKKGRVVKEAKVEWWIEGVPTAALDFYTNPPYLVITTNGAAVTVTLPVEVLKQNVAELDDLALGQSLNEQFYLDGVTNGWTVSGLPAGLKYTAKLMTTRKKVGKKTVVTTNALPYSVYGKTTKAGLFTITAKKQAVAGRSSYLTMKYRVLVTPKAPDAARFGTNLTNITTMAYVPVKWNLATGGGTTFPAVSAVGGKVAQVSGLPTGLKLSGQTIAGTPTKPGTYVVTFTKNVKSGRKTVAKTAQVLWKVVANDAKVSLGFNEAGGVVEGGMVGLKYADLLAFTATEGAKVTVSGLPAGMKLVKLEGGGPAATVLPGCVAWGFAGYTAKAGTYLVTVKATLNGRTVTQRLALEVEGLPVWAKGTFNGVVRGDGALAASPNGLATVTVSSAGKISGKFQELGTNWTFNAACYTARTADAFACTNVVATHSYKVTKKVKGKKKTVTKKLTRVFAFMFSPVPVAPDVSEVPVRGVATARRASAPGQAIEAWQNLWGRAAYKALGGRLFYTSKKVPYRAFTFRGTDGKGAAIGLSEKETLSLKVTPKGAVTATMSFDTGRTKKDPRTKKKVKVFYKATCSTVVIPASAADAEPFEGGAWVYFAPAPGSGFGGLAGWVPLP